MLSVGNIVRRNAATFYNYRTGARYNLTPRYVVLGTLAILLAGIFGQRDNDLYDGIITSLAILVGFSFNVMVFLASRRQLTADDPTSLEQVHRAARLNELARELFYNLSYFNLTAVSAVVLALSLLALSAESFDSRSMEQWAAAQLGWNSQQLGRLLIIIRESLTAVAIAVLYFLVAESVLSFARLITRSTYYFESKVVVDPPTQIGSKD